MKNLLLKIFVSTALLIGAQSASAEMKILTAAQVKVDLGKVARPSCDMLAWRWVTAISRLSEAEGMNAKQLAKSGDLENLSLSMGRLAQGSAEGSDDLISEEVTFNSKDIADGNVEIDVIDTASIKWVMSTVNVTDRVSFHAANGKLTVKAKMTYGQYCFYPNSSKITGTVNGRVVEFQWATREVNLDAYMNLLK